MQDKQDEAEKKSTQEKIQCETARNESARYKDKLIENNKEIQFLNKQLITLTADNTEFK